MQNHLQFCSHKPALIFHLHQVCVSLYLVDRCLNTVPWQVNIYILQNGKQRVLYSEQCAVILQYAA